MKGRGRRPSQLPLWLRAVRTAIVIELAISGALGVRATFPTVQSVVRDDSHLTANDYRFAAGDKLRLPRAPLDAFRQAVRPRERFYVQVPEGRRGQFITRGEVIRDYLSFFLLPAIRTIDPAKAAVFLQYRFDGSYSVKRK